jgi:site-specific recombinase XerD
MITLTRNIKHKAIIALAYSSGLRKGELQMLKPADIDSGRQQIRVRNGKGKKDRYALLSLKMLEMLRGYYKTIRPKVYLFESSHKINHPLAATTLTQIVKQAAERAEIKKCVTFHTLRHCFATHMLENGVNLRIIQQLMGHTSLKTTAGYLHVANIDPHTVSSPFDNLAL